LWFSKIAWNIPFVSYFRQKIVASKQRYTMLF